MYKDSFPQTIQIAIFALAWKNCLQTSLPEVISYNQENNSYINYWSIHMCIYQPQKYMLERKCIRPCDSFCMLGKGFCFN